MLELPDYSCHLLQQLWGLRQEGQFCDCTILVGDVPHRAHKLVLAASSMLFRSLLMDSDTINIDTDVVSAQEFGCLLDMIYTGKLPIGKHNASRIVAAADSLQMFHVAVAFKNILSRVVGQQTAKQEMDSSSERPESCGPGEAEEPQRNRLHRCEPAASPPSSGPDKLESSKTLREDYSQLIEASKNMADIAELMSKAATSTLDESAREVVHQCCEEADPRAVVEKLLDGLREGQLTERDLLRVLECVQKDASSGGAVVLKATQEDSPRTEIKAASKEPDCVRGCEQQQQQEEREEEEERMVEAENPKILEESKDPDPDAPTSSAYSCRWCKKGFNYKCRMLAHLKRCSMSAQKCPDCSKNLASAQALRRHRAEEHANHAEDKKKVACDLCGRTFAHPSGMIYHKRTEHFEERPFACERCGAKFGANSSLKNHMRLHTGEKPYQCRQCNMRFSVAAALAYHTKKKHSKGKMYTCQYCKAVFAQSIELTRHVRTHTGDRPYVCRECGKGYSQASGLTVHLQTTHNMTEPYDCQKCCLTFTSLEENQEHIEQFHMRESHQCSVCDKMFSSAAVRDRHRAAHHGAKPFTCDLCNKSYQQPSGLWHHNRTNHPDVFASQTEQLQSLLQCDVCFKFFPCAATLTQHRSSEHPGSQSLGREQELQEHVSPPAPAPPLQEPCDQQGEQEGPTALVAPQETQKVLVSVVEGKEDVTSTEVVEVNMYDLINSAVTFICESK